MADKASKPVETARGTGPRQAAVALQTSQALFDLGRRLNDIDSRAASTADRLVAAAASEEFQSLVQHSPTSAESFPALLSSIQELHHSLRAQSENSVSDLSDLMAAVQLTHPSS